EPPFLGGFQLFEERARRLDCDRAAAFVPVRIEPEERRLFDDRAELWNDLYRVSENATHVRLVAEVLSNVSVQFSRQLDRIEVIEDLLSPHGIECRAYVRSCLDESLSWNTVSFDDLTS